jgi:hypothetical protein
MINTPANWLLHILTFVRFGNSTFCPHSGLKQIAGLSKQTAVFPCTALIGFIIEGNSVYCAVRTESLKRNQINISI